MNSKTVLASAFLASAALLAAAAPSQAAPAHSGVAPAASAAAVSGEAKNVTVDVAMDQLGVGNKLSEALRSIKTDSRDTFVKEAVNKAFETSGSGHNVMLFNLSQNYLDQLQGTRIYANVKWGNFYFGLWVFESGTFANKGDAGYSNWGYRGWWTRDGATVTFQRP